MTLMSDEDETAPWANGIIGNLGWQFKVVQFVAGAMVRAVGGGRWWNGAAVCLLLCLGLGLALGQKNLSKIPHAKNKLRHPHGPFALPASPCACSFVAPYVRESVRSFFPPEKKKYTPPQFLLGHLLRVFDVAAGQQLVLGCPVCRCYCIVVVGFFYFCPRFLFSSRASWPVAFSQTDCSDSTARSAKPCLCLLPRQPFRLPLFLSSHRLPGPSDRLREQRRFDGSSIRRGLVVSWHSLAYFTP